MNTGNNTLPTRDMILGIELFPLSFRRNDRIISTRPKDRESVLKNIIDIYGNEDYDKKQWENVRIYKEFIEKYSHLKPLSLDYGFISHLHEFFDMAKNTDISKMNYQNVRTLLKEKLGNKTLYRGMGLTEEQLFEIINTDRGVECSFLRSMLNYEDAIRRPFELLILSSPIRKTIEDHYKGNTNMSVLISTSVYPDVAIAVANKCKMPNTQVYLFELEVPEIDIIRYSEHTFFPSTVKKDNEYTPMISIVIDEYKKDYICEDNVQTGECLIPYKISSDEIKNVFKPNIIKQAYYEWWKKLNNL